MARIDPVHLAQITEVVEGDNVLQFIEAANVLVTKHLVASAPGDAVLKNVELWLSAHFYAMYRRRLESGSAGDTSEKYEGKTDMYFEATTYGQQALALDTTGELAKLQNTLKTGAKRSVFTWLGKHRTGGPQTVIGSSD